MYRNMRVAVSVLATTALLLLCSGVLLAVLNLQGYVPQAHSWIYMPVFAELSMPGTVVSVDWTLSKKQARSLMLLRRMLAAQ